jgi:hypothetical protein
MFRIRQYRLRISQWGLDKNIKEREMKYIVRQRQRRKLVDDHKNPFQFTVRGNEVEEGKIDRFMKRKGIPPSLLYSPRSVGCELRSVPFKLQ